ncbi:CpaF family protein [Cryobacterium tagatosivorans]|uniref:CpaF family protein n=1 Tax=Cryobacterium tagatosivorans TaxID=1259199 RepID=A0A4R8UEA2_9MICO|nr:CpaF family protein [Cryobacterium tagatosivorans]TFB48958.1 CpaF family protein [Cryobacterium tagatosivorans]
MRLNERVDAVRQGPQHLLEKRPSMFTKPKPIDEMSVSAVRDPLQDAVPERAPVVKPVAKPATPPPVDPLAEIKERAAQELFERIGSRLNDSSLSEEQLHAYARTELSNIVSAEQVPLSAEERARLILEIGADVLGYGPLEVMLKDDAVTEIMVNGHEQIFVERHGRLSLSEARFTSEAQLRRVIERIVSKVGRRIDESSPLVDARLADGSRVNAIIPPLAVDGSSLTIRKFAREPFTAHDLIGFGTLSPDMARVLDACVKARLNIIVSGGTGTGKTTLLNVLSAYIPEEERIITIEDAVELQLQQEHVIRLESRPSNIEGKGEITIRDLVRNSLRMRPDRIVIGECRGGETLDMLQAMNTGHEGSISTVHCNSPRDAIARLETLVLMAGMDIPLRAIREQIASAVDVIVQITRLKDGTRRVTHVTEVQGMEGDVVTLQDAFIFDYSAGVDDDGRFLGHAVATGVRPRFADKFKEMGIDLAASVFQAELHTKAAR